MFENIVPVSFKEHKGKKIKSINSFDFAKDFHIASIMAHEFSRSASIYPIVFVEDKQRDEFRPVVLLGLEAGENLFVDEEGRWDASYIPAIIRRYPFALARTQEEGQFTICLDKDSKFIDESEGQPLFNDDGEPGEVMQRVKRYLGELQQMEGFTQQMCQSLAELNLFTPLNMRVRQADQVKNIAGCYVVNEERLNNLSDERFLELRSKRYLPAMYAHLTSLAQIERLLKIKEGGAQAQAEQEKEEQPVH